MLQKFDEVLSSGNTVEAANIALKIVSFTQKDSGISADGLKNKQIYQGSMLRHVKHFAYEGYISHGPPKSYKSTPPSRIFS